MKNKNKLTVVGSLTCLAALTAFGQDTRPLDTRPLPNDYRASNHHDVGLTKANKASGLIGMDVRNAQNEKLGDIKDLVLDLPSGRIAYAVLSVGGFLGINEKYIAVPPSELRLGPDGRELILNADKARIQTAPGFTKGNWPDYNDQTWRSHSSYWLPGGAAVGTPGEMRSGHESGGTLRDTDGSYSGRILAVDGGTKTITVEGASGRHTFHMGSSASLLLRNDANARLENLRVGDHVTVRYHNQNGTEVADSVTDTQQR